MTLATPKAPASTRLASPERFSWLESIRGDLDRLTEKIQIAAQLDHLRLDPAVTRLFKSGGKRMRPAMTLLVGRACYAPFEDTLAVAAAIELLHTATLVHDDLIDNANERRGTVTLHRRFSPEVTILTGDFLFARAAALTAEPGNERVVQVFSETIVKICQGEILQARTRWQVPSLAIYQQRIYGKTAALFEAATVSGALLGKNPSEDVITGFAQFGREVGMAFQIIDDTLDFVSNTQKLGKPAGHDLSQGNINLPAMIYLEQSGMTPEEFVAKIRHTDHRETLSRAIRDTGAVHQSLEAAKDYITRAESILNALPIETTPSLSHLVTLAYSTIERDF